MLFKIDESLPVEAAALLRDRGHDAATVYDELLQGSPDDAIYEVCQVEQRVLISLDKDFADIRRYPPQSSAGCIVLRLARLDKASVLTALEQVAEVIAVEPLNQRLWIVDETRVRIRGETLLPEHEDDED
jgi:predicted nuclease of predicted toxin-antitoxin system